MWSFIHDDIKIKSISKILFLVVIFLTRLPPFYTVPFIQNPLLNSHSIARYILIIILFLIIIRQFKNPVKLKIDKELLVITLFFFFSQSISVISAINIEAFLTLYKHVLFSFLIFIVGILIIETSKDIENIIFTIIITIVINIAYEYLLYFQPFFHFLLMELIYSKEWEVTELNLNRDRYFVAIYDSALIPLIIYLFYSAKNLSKRILFFLLSIFVFFFTYISNFRSQFFMALESLLFVLLIFFRQVSIKKILSYIFILIFTFYLVILLTYDFRLTSLTRIIEPEKEDYRTIQSRLDWWQESLDIASYSPLTGVGLRNYYDYLRKNDLKYLFPNEKRLQMITLANPHSIIFSTIAETGILGLIALSTLILYFLKIDYESFKKNKIFLKIIIACFWVLFSFSLMNPPDTLPYLSLFWLLRAIIHKTSSIKMSN